MNNDREKLEGRLAQLRSNNIEMQQNLAQVRQTERTLVTRLDENVGAQKEVDRMLQELGDENAGDNGKPPAEAENTPEAKAPKKPAASG